MRLFATALFGLLLAGSALAQSPPDWRYQREITFPAANAPKVRLAHLTVTADGSVWAVSSAATDTSAHNAVWKAAPGATVFSLVQDFTAEQVGIVHALRGITSFGNHVVVSSHVAPPAPQGNLHYYPDGDRARMRTLNSAAGNAGYGTYVYALSATPEGMVYGTVSFQPSIRLFDLRDPSSATFGNWVPMDPNRNNEAGGHDGCGISALRDLALVPGTNYMATTSRFFTSRNGSPDPLPQGCTATLSGRVSIWTGGTQAAPGSYTNQPLVAAGGTLDITRYLSTGLTADRAGRVWVTGPDSTRRWVKVFDTSAAPAAFEEFSLPSATTPIRGEANPQGAPFNAPVDVALSADEAYAYVADRNARRVFVFADANLVAGEGGAGRAAGVTLWGSQPNPVRTTATLRFTLDAASDVRLAVYDVLGREVARVADGPFAAGTHAPAFDASALPAGTYRVRLEAQGQSVTRSLVRVR